MDPCCFDENTRCQVDRFHYRDRVGCVDLIGGDCDHSKLPKFCTRDAYDLFICCDGKEIDAESVNNGLSKCSKNEDDRVDFRSCLPDFLKLKFILPILITIAISILLIVLWVCRRRRKARNSGNANANTSINTKAKTNTKVNIKGSGGIIVTGAPPPPVFVGAPPVASGTQSSVSGAFEP